MKFYTDNSYTNRWNGSKNQQQPSNFTGCISLQRQIFFKIIAFASLMLMKCLAMIKNHRGQ
jgi:hypothetical protein